MSKLREPINLETTFGTYIVDEVIGEGGAGRVYAGTGPDSIPVAVKVLSKERASSDKRRRFKNEITFLSRNAHPNIVTVIDYGIAQTGTIAGPFYVMKRYDHNLRNLIGKIPPPEVLTFYSQILDGVEAAHLKEVVHRDLKPENILFEKNSRNLAIADFGIARFTEELLTTKVETLPTQRLANFMYAAPEQRTAGEDVTKSADIYALGLMLNEMLTSVVPLGTEYQIIGEKNKDLAFLDTIVAKMISQSPKARPSSIAEVKNLIQRHRAEAVSQQRLSEINGTVIKLNTIDEPLASEPPRVVDANWDRGRLILTLDREVSGEWVDALHQMRSFTSVSGIPPTSFQFSGKTASVTVDAHSAQRVIDYFKQWLPMATQGLKYALEQKAREDEQRRRDQLNRERLAEEERLRVNQSLKF